MIGDRFRRWAAVGAAILAAVGLLSSPSASAAPAAASDRLTWGAPTLVDPQHGFASVSCVTRLLCRAGDVNDRIERWDGVHWSHGTSLSSVPGAAIADMSCSSTTFCAAVQLLPDAESGFYGIYDRYRPIVRRADGSWNTSAAVRTFRNESASYNHDVSCPSRDFCMLLAGATYQVWNGSSWSAPKEYTLAGMHSERVSCVSSTMCLRTDADGRVARWDGARWTRTREVIRQGARSVDCATTTSCIVVTNSGARRWNGSTWGTEVAFVPSGPLAYVADASCPSVTFCEVVDSFGYAFTFRGSEWGGRHRLTPRGHLLAVSCSSTAFCVAITDRGEAFHRRDGAWQPARVGDLTVGGFASISCDSPVLCLVVDRGGAAAAFNGSSWTTPRRVDNPPPTFTGVSCVGGSFCMAAGDGGEVRIRSHGQWGNGIAVRDDANGLSADRGIHAISCGTQTLCMVTGGPDDYVFRWDGASWHIFFYGYADDFGGVADAVASCSLDGCVAHYWVHGGENGESGQTLVYHADGTTEHLPASGHLLSYMSCVTVSFCMAGDDMFDGEQWTDVPGGGPDFVLNDLSCATTTFCVAVSDDSVSTWNGTAWSVPHAIIDPSEAPGFTGFRHVSCKRTICAATDYTGWVVVAT